ncbi:hypothetical protein H6P81_012269 [Aristolochia fimbriata]|uniref:Aminotransferase-like plant mobile domain-containing protein n=1 Tax=Aristolochia fimbriata TaxID=158543 RepID=A0AAV7EE44_ARIFI|nr:hypothetical protein H6P81_012269 [Aristolochia fimbriata]
MNEAFDVPTPEKYLGAGRSVRLPPGPKRTPANQCPRCIHNSMDWRDDDKGRYLCGNRKQPGHNKRACKAPFRQISRVPVMGSRRPLDARNAPSISALYHIGPWTSRMLPHVEAAGFWCTTRVRWLRPDKPLITALVERWRSETNTFHLANGEMTITLEDGGILLDYAGDGDAVTGSTSGDWMELAEYLRGRAPTEVFKGSTVTFMA